MTIVISAQHICFQMYNTVEHPSTEHPLYCMKILIRYSRLMDLWMH